MHKLIFFDLDGTLTDSGTGIIRSLEYAFRELGYEVPSVEQLRMFIGPPLVSSFREYAKFDDETTQRAIAKYRERYVVKGIYENEPYDGIAELLSELKSAGARLAIATTKPEHMAKTVTDHFGMTELFETVSGAEGEGDTKAGVIRKACGRMGISEDEMKTVLMVGDRKYDIEGAHACGMKCVAVGYGFAPEGEFAEYGADFVADNVPELREILLKN